MHNILFYKLKLLIAISSIDRYNLHSWQEEIRLHRRVEHFGVPYIRWLFLCPETQFYRSFLGVILSSTLCPRVISVNNQADLFPDKI